MRVVLILVVLGVFFARCGESEEPVSEKSNSNKKARMIGSTLDLMYQQNKLNGCVLVSEHNEIIFKKCFGYSNFETKDTLKPEDRFRISSLSLQMTAMSLMILEKQGLLSFNDDLQKFLPELPYEGITIKQCLQHTSGLPDYIWLMEERATDTTLFNNKDVLDVLVEKVPTMHHSPGEKWEFSGTGYVLMPLIVERLSGQSFKEFMQDNIFSPLGMKNTLITTGVDENILNRVNGYNGSEKVVDFHRTNGIVGDGGIYSTVEDLFIWDQGLYTEKLVKKQVLAEASRPYRLGGGLREGDYGFGVYIYNFDGIITLEHEGQWLGFHNYLMRDITNKNLIAILTNNNQDPEILVEIIDDILVSEEYNEN